MEKFGIDVSLLNLHLSGASKDTTRNSLFNTVMFHAHDGVIDVVSCDGRILMHTELNAEKAGLGGGFDEIVLRIPSGKVAGKKGERAIITIDGGNSRIATCKNVIVPEIVGNFPLWRQVMLPDDAKTMDSVEWFDPKYLMLVYDYIERNIPVYRHPQSNGGPAMWTLSQGFEKRQVVLAPLRAA